MTEEPNKSEVRVEGGDELEFGVTMKDGRVILKFNKLINWFDLDPQTAIAYAEAIINNAYAAQEEVYKRQGLLRANGLPGIPRGR